MKNWNDARQFTFDCRAAALHKHRSCCASCKSTRAHTERTLRTVSCPKFMHSHDRKVVHSPSLHVKPACDSLFIVQDLVYGVKKLAVHKTPLSKLYTTPFVQRSCTQTFLSRDCVVATSPLLCASTKYVRTMCRWTVGLVEGCTHMQRGQASERTDPSRRPS